jgi:GT2 family glycosyltransferase
MRASGFVVSVVVPTHHRTRELRLLLESLSAQTLPHEAFEVIVIGDEGDPGEAVVTEFARLRRLDVRFGFVPNDPWRGKSPSLKRNFGAAQAHADWIAFIDDDCVADENWLTGSTPYFDDPANGGVEGRKTIPKTDPPTLTYRGLLLFTRPGGYQTANMFYRRALFQEIGGFDTMFPFYLEDTDLAWSVLDRGLRIPHASEAVVTHPVPPAEPLRLLANAKRAVLMPYLYKKHPERFRTSHMKTVARGHWPYLLAYAALAGALVMGRWLVALAALGLIFALTVGHTCKLFWRCRFTSNEILITGFLLPIVPLVTLAQLLRGNVRNRVLLLR